MLSENTYADAVSAMSGFDLAGRIMTKTLTNCKASCEA